MTKRTEQESIDWCDEITREAARVDAVLVALQAISELDNVEDDRVREAVGWLAEDAQGRLKHIQTLVTEEAYKK